MARGKRFAVGCGVVFGLGLWVATTFVAVVWSNLSSNRLVHRWDQPAGVSYGSFEPYTVYALEGSRRWNVLGPANRRYDLWVAPRTETFPDHGHHCEYDFHHSLTDPDVYVRSCAVEWSPDGVTLTEPTGHKLFVPKSAFVGGR